MGREELLRVTRGHRGDVMIAPAARLSCLFIGQDRSGHWVVKDARSLCGGLFANRSEARFAMHECQRRSQSIIVLLDGLELNGPLCEYATDSPEKRQDIDRAKAGPERAQI
jgi:hypothetical protein